MKDKFIEEYEINPCTMLIIPHVYGSKIYSKIIELEDEIISPFKPIDIIKASCEFFGSSYEGRKNGSRRLIGITHKAPIAIDPTNSIYFFPTTSSVRPECIWVSHEHVLHHRRSDSNITHVTFRNKETFGLPISARSFNNQLIRTAHLRTKLAQRMSEMERKTYFYLHTPKFLTALEKRDEYEENRKKRSTHLFD
ncbi:competence protein ComK [Bacillus sp. CGMCC 1.16607]|uniref:competence protein ComK n=1 Tax=Bacillus sp. CGMCC 1.16607 TaxID=3351842 RepID=UPI0036343B73